MAYTETWSDDGGAYNALTKRSLEFIETEAAKMLQGHAPALLDASGNGHHLKTVGTPAEASSGPSKYGESLDLSKDGFDALVNRDDSLSQSSDADFAVFMAVTLDEVPSDEGGSPDFDYLMGLQEQVGGASYFTAAVENSNDELRYNDDATGGVNSGTSVTPGDWQLVVHGSDNGDGTRDITTELHDSDGTIQHSVEISDRDHPNLDGTARLSVGFLESEDGQSIDGRVHEARFWTGGSVPSLADLRTMADPTATGVANFEQTGEGNETAFYRFEGSTGPTGAWGEESANRSFDTIETNDSGSARLVVVTVTLTPNFSLAGEVTVSATAELGSDLSSSVDHTPGAVSQNASSASRDRDIPLIFVVNPGEEYRVTRNDADGTVSISEWYEFDFSNVHTAQTWTTGETGTETKVNNYADGVNAIVQAQSSYDLQQPSSSMGTEESLPVATLVNADITAGDSDEEARVRQRDFGGSMTTIGRVRGSLTQGFPLMLNGGGAFVSEVVQSGATLDVYDQARFDAKDPIVFVAGEDPSDAATSTEQKWKDLDVNASTGWNSGLSMTRATSTGGGVPSDGSASTPSSSHVALVLLHVSLDPGSVSSASATIDVGGVNGPEVVAPAGTQPQERTLLFATSPGESWSVTTSNATVEERTEWVVQT